MEIFTFTGQITVTGALPQLGRLVDAGLTWSDTVDSTAFLDAEKVNRMQMSTDEPIDLIRFYLKGQKVSAHGYLLCANPVEFLIFPVNATPPTTLSQKLANALGQWTCSVFGRKPMPVCGTVMLLTPEMEVVEYSFPALMGILEKAWQSQRRLAA